MAASKHLVCLFPWLEVGGADKFNLDLLRCLRDRGWTATIVTTLPAQHSWKCLFENVANEIIDLAGFEPTTRPNHLAQLLTEHPPDVLFLSHSWAGYRLLPFLRHHFPTLPIVDYCHLEELNWANGGFPKLSAESSAWLHLRLVTSEHLKSWSCQRGGDPDRTWVCTVNVDPTEWNPDHYDRAALRQSLQLNDNTPVALYAGRLVRQKRPILALAIMREVLAQLPNAVFLIAGDGLFSGYLRAAIRHYRLESQIRLLGNVSHLRIRELLAASDIFFLPSKMEGISLAIFEAMSMGVVPVSADVGGQRELVTPDCGILIPQTPIEIRTYAETLVRLMNDPQQLQSMGRASRRRIAQDFRLDQMGDRMNSALCHAIRFHQEQPLSVVSAAEADASKASAISAAQRFEQTPVNHPSLRRSLKNGIRALYWRSIEVGAWRFLPTLEKAGERWQLF